MVVITIAEKYPWILRKTNLSQPVITTIRLLGVFVSELLNKVNTLYSIECIPAWRTGNKNNANVISNKGNKIKSREHKMSNSCGRTMVVSNTIVSDIVYKN